MQAEPTVRFRVDPEMRRLLDRLRDEKDINVSAWVRRQLRAALEREFPDVATTEATEPDPTPIETPEALEPDPTPIETPETLEPDPTPIEGWKPRRLSDGDWGAILEDERVAELPDNDHLLGFPIIVTSSKGDSWDTTIDEVVSRTESSIVIRTSGRPSS